jgi:RES domain-containing protein
VEQPLWRIAADTPDYGADDLSGLGAKKSGGRWNRKGTPLVYASFPIALACLETVVHLGGSFSLPLNRYLVRIDVPEDAWAARTVFDPSLHVGWDALPAGLVSLDWGTLWARSASSLVAEVPSIVVLEERNVLINPAHPAAAALVAKKVRRWTYDRRLA